MFFVQTYQKKKKRFHTWIYHLTKTEKIKNLHILKCYVTVTEKDAYVGQKKQLQNHSLNFIHKNEAILSATSILSSSSMAYNTTASLDNLTCTDYVDFGKYQDRFGLSPWSKNDSKHLSVKLKVFKEYDNKDFRLVQNPKKGEASFNQFMRLRNQLVIAAEKFAKE